MVKILLHATNIQNTKFYKLIWLFLCFHGTIELFYLNDEIKLKQNQLVTILRTLPKEYEISFEIKPTAFIPAAYCIIHLTINSNRNYYGDRVYGMWNFDSLKLGYIYISINGEVDSYFPYDLTAIPIMEWTKIVATQKLSNGKYLLNVYIGKVNALSVEIINPSEYNDVKVYMGDPWYDVQTGYIRYLFTDATSDSFTLKEETQIIYNQLNAVFYKISKEYMISFEFKPTKYKSDVWSSILHLSSNENEAVYGHNAPGVFISPYSYLTISSAINYDANSSKIYEEKILPLEEWTQIKIEQVFFESKYIFSIKINETKVYSVENTDAREFQNVKVYLGNPWIEAQSGHVRNPVIVNALQDKRNNSLITNLSSNITNEEVYIHVNIATSKICQIDLENVTIQLHHENILSFKRFNWDYLGLNATSIQMELKFIIIYVRKLFIDSYVKFSSVYDIDKNGVPLGKTKASVIVNFGSFEFSLGKMIFKIKKNVLYVQGMFSQREKTIPDLNKINQQCCIGDQNGTFLQLGAYQFKCTSLHKRQQSFCFQREINTGEVKFLPIQLLNIIGCDSNTSSVYGRTFRNKVVEININKKKPVVIIANEKWLSLKSSITLLNEK